VLEVRCGSAVVVSALPAKAQQTKNETANVVIQQHSRKILMMGIVMAETC